MTELKETLARYLRAGRDALAWKLDGLDEYDVRRPLTDSGTNLLGIVKHVAAVQAGYLGDCFGRPFPDPPQCLGPDAEDNEDMWALPHETRADIEALWARSNAHADATVAALDLDAAGHVPWWPAERNPVTLGQILVHLIAEVHRHAGHADLVRELIDGSIGLNATNAHLPPGDAAWWTAHRRRLQETAEGFRP